MTRQWGSRLITAGAITIMLVLAGCGGDGSGLNGVNDSADSKTSKGSPAERRLSPALLTTKDLPSGFKLAKEDDDDSKIVSTTNQRCTDEFQKSDVPGQPAAKVERHFATAEDDHLISHSVAQYADASWYVRVLDEYRQMLAACSNWTQQDSDDVTMTLSFQDTTPQTEQLTSVRFTARLQASGPHGQQMAFLEGAIFAGGQYGAFIATTTPSPSESLLDSSLVAKIRDKLAALPG